MKFNINRKKRIGKVVFVVEGEQTEPDLFKKIFNNLLGYDLQIIKRNGIEIETYKGHDDFSQVTIINSRYNNIYTIQKEEYFDYLYELQLKYNVDLKNYSTYFIFDRDPQNNKYGLVKELIGDLKASLNDSIEQNGLLLLSYPSIEAFLYNCNVINGYNNCVNTGGALKKLCADNNLTINRLNFELINNGTCELADFLSEICELSIFKLNLDDFSLENLKILEIQQEHYKKSQTFYCISMILIALIDLQIIEIQEDS